MYTDEKPDLGDAVKHSQEEYDILKSAFNTATETHKKEQDELIDRFMKAMEEGSMLEGEENSFIWDD